MLTVWSLVSGFVGGVIAWIVTATVGQPLQHFLQLRHDAAFALAQFDESAWSGNPDAEPPTSDWLIRRTSSFDATGSALLAFAASNILVARALRWRAWGRFRCYPQSAGGSLRMLAEARPGTQTSEQLRRQVLSSLKLARWPQGVL